MGVGEDPGMCSTRVRFVNAERALSPVVICRFPGLAVPYAHVGSAHLYFHG